MLTIRFRTQPNFLAKGDAMTRRISHREYQEVFEYHGNTCIERVCYHDSGSIRREWLLFDTVEEAAEVFNECCC
jgi:hypothetical protein